MAEINDAEIEKKTVLRGPVTAASPPPPPPPLPTPPIWNFTRKVSTTKNSVDSDNLDPEKVISRACGKLWYYLTKDLAEDCGILSIYYHVKPILQEGPKCGLVALCMTSQLYNAQKPLEVDRVFAYAKEKGFSNQGEMFSVNDMAALAEDLLKVQARVLQDLSSNEDSLLAHLCHGWPVLVPYDADGNHEPCLRKGHSAHWALITGFCIVCSEDLLSNLSQVQNDMVYPRLLHASPYIAFSQISRIIHDKSEKRIFLYARQGKSLHLGIWRFEDLCASNCNLIELNPKFNNDPAQIILTEGSVSTGLNNKYIFLYPKF